MLLPFPHPLSRSPQAPYQCLHCPFPALHLWILVGGSSLLGSPHCGFLLFQRGNELFVSLSHLHSESHDTAATRLDLPQVCCWSCPSLCTLCCLVSSVPRTPAANLSVCHGSDSSSARIVFNKMGCRELLEGWSQVLISQFAAE